MSTEDRIYVGYLQMSGRQCRFTLIAIAFIVLAGVATSGLVAHSLRHSGTGEWDTSHTVTITGVARLAPYPHLETSDGPVLLALPGKHGAQDRIAGIDEQTVTISGTTLKRGDLRALEIAEISAPNGERTGTPQIVLETDEITIRGEILDSKCYLGAMKPGDGPAHKACAILCLRGGIAPLFVGEDEDGRAVAAVLCRPNGRPITDDTIALAGEPVIAKGQLGRVGSLPVFICTETDIQIADN